MNKTSKELDLSSIITQVSKDDENNRSIPLTTTVASSGASQTTNVTKTRSSRKQRVVNLLLCCLGGSCRHRSSRPIYSPSNDQPADHESSEKHLLPTLRDPERAKICLIIDLDETLVHSVFRPVPNADFIVPVEIDGQVHQIYVTKRPHVDEFLRRVGELYECVLFTASLAKYADPVADLLDPKHIFHSRLFRDSCTYYNGNYIKDLSRLGRDIRKVIIIDNSPLSYLFHQDNAVPVTSWFDDMHDTELLTLIPIFERLASVDDVIPALQDIHHRRAIV
jgi:RNA polymerase II subunit A small phosphatase-like protein